MFKTVVFKEGVYSEMPSKKISFEGVEYVRKRPVADVAKKALAESVGGKSFEPFIMFEGKEYSFTESLSSYKKRILKESSDKAIADVIEVDGILFHAVK